MTEGIRAIREKLDEKIPRDVVKQREGGGGKSFSYLEGHYVIARMNEIFGQGNWAYIAEDAKCVFEGEVNGKHTCHYIARVRVEVPALGHALFVDYGYGDGSDKVNPGKAHELAVKEAVTDGLKRAAKNLGMSMGLALYDKTQENVDDGEKTVGTQQPKPRPKMAQAKTSQENTARQVSAAQPARAVAMGPVPGKSPETISAPSAEDAPPEDRELLNKLLSEMAENIATRSGRPNKGATISGLLKHMRGTYAVQRKEELTDEQAKEFYTYLRGKLNDGQRTEQ